jgi:hypothetical protein
MFANSIIHTNLLMVSVVFTSSNSLDHNDSYIIAKSIFSLLYWVCINIAWQHTQGFNHLLVSRHFLLCGAHDSESSLSYLLVIPDYLSTSSLIIKQSLGQTDYHSMQHWHPCQQFLQIHSMLCPESHAKPCLSQSVVMMQYWYRLGKSSFLKVFLDCNAQNLGPCTCE